MNDLYKTIMVGCLLLTASWLHAQDILYIANGGRMYVQPDASISFDSLVLTPSSGLSLTRNTISKSSTIRQPNTTGLAISRVYGFQYPLSGFAGNVTIVYKDDELNGIDENTLVIDAYRTNIGWQDYKSSQRDTSSNNVFIPDVADFPLDEITLVGAGLVLPLQWLSVEATRKNNISYISWTTAQEVNCKYYQLQKSTDGGITNWQNVGNPVAARNNTSGFNNYSLTDATFLNGTAYYRIVSTDAAGRVSYSAVVSVMDVLQQLVTVYPNPATNIIHIQAGNGTVIKRVKVFNAAGKLLMVKEGNNSNVYSFTVTALASGFYMLAIETNTGSISKGFMK